MDKIKRIISNSIVVVASLILTIAILMFVIMNEGVIWSSAGLGILLIFPIIMIGVGYIIIAKTKPMENRQSKWRAWFDIVLAGVTLLVCILFALVVDFVQPLKLNNTTTILMIVGAVLLLVGAVCEIISDRGRFARVVASSLFITMLVGIIWVNAEGYKPFNEEIITDNIEVFKNGEEGYTTFRIPSIVVLDKDVINAKKGGSLKQDVLLATAEGRRNSSHDTGAIDLVAKVSRDGGKTWGKLQMLYGYKDVVGKYGNPTPVLDRNTGKLIFPYMTRINGVTKGYDTYIAVCDVDREGNITPSPQSEHVDISPKKTMGDSGSSDGVNKDTLMIGPGKSIQLRDGRIVIPASSDGKSFVLYLDKDMNPLKAENWKRGASAGYGNECEVVELMNGELRMVVRDNTGCCDNHFEQYQRLSYSKDGGKTWYEKTVNTELRSPICMSSLDMLSNGAILLTYPDSFYTRVNLTVARSYDNGKTFKTYPIYGGPAGYSCVAVDSNDNIYVLAEIGKVNYNEELRLFKLDASKLVD